MCDFDLSQALDSSPECEETGSESCCFDMTDVQDEFFQLDEGLCMLVSRNRKTLRSVANLLLAANRMTRSVSRGDSELSDEELCSAILESLVTETVVTATEASSTGVKKIFERMNSGNLCTLCDCSQKDIVRASGDLKLQAVTLQGGHGDKKVNFKLSRYISRCSSADGGAPVLLSITNKLHMSCCMEDGKAELKPAGMPRGGFKEDQRRRRHGPVPLLQEDQGDVADHLRVGEVQRLVHQHLPRRRAPAGGDV
ncbi:hypothetical protein FQN60_000033 [Etheostoma spectabile]|uniref:Interleukin-1 beta n=1 Tax=Etheostoma spectabile TaxID=54343 RepID=A0A5J5CFW1_9PERO|nr:hypothetical protein FQN60_000033 [Etheostoma spectabile]